MTGTRSRLILFLYNYLKFFTPVLLLAVTSVSLMYMLLKDAEEDNLINLARDIKALVESDPDILHNVFLTSKYKIFVTDYKGNLLYSSDKKIDYVEKHFQEVIRNVGNVVYMDNMVMVALPVDSEKINGYVIVVNNLSTLRNKMYLTLASLGSSAIIVSVVISLLSYWEMRKREKIYQENAQKLRNMALYLAHEVKTPLSVVLARVYSSDCFDEEGKKSISRAIRRLVKLNKNLKVLAEGSFIKPTFTFVDLKGVVEEIAHQYQSIFSDKVLHLRLDNVSIVSDYELIYTLILNLVDNAFKHSPEGSSVEVSLEDREQDVRLEILNQKREDAYTDESSYRIGRKIVEEIVNLLKLGMEVREDSTHYRVVLTFAKKV
ncbi:ATP-binding region ATPase domain protein [Thermocrinis albus DSM 14484]|uniref:histidine kinase n=1 Tax=Thermocrinis albus (strain DSM 14484 / JCM 11386 / HI 11/12) TaxID=638303 RepID=D3SME9_THEAH|nr:HAMP domain-containing sensor histidine kinase [Thermocrinis albus]ADC89929.1 ATP-binding region ATPase domain protein [Thermocrinis albus DSM 14484]